MKKKPQYTSLGEENSLGLESKRIALLVLLYKPFQFLLYIVLVQCKWVAF
jgi:hypothetical protein